MFSHLLNQFFSVFAVLYINSDYICSFKVAYPGMPLLWKFSNKKIYK